MTISLTHFAESLFTAMVNERPDTVLAACGLGESDLACVNKLTGHVAECHVALEPYGGRRFDGASRVDVVVRVSDEEGVGFELKLGESGLSKKQVHEKWLKACKESHQGKRWKGSMMAILDRRFPPTVKDDLRANLGTGSVVLRRDWIIVARQEAVDTWSRDEPDFGPHVKRFAFENVVKAFGGKQEFNRFVRHHLTERPDYFNEWFGAREKPKR